ncbi:ribonuclease H-like domain-containing protein [Tanacetum coccineum]
MYQPPGFQDSAHPDYICLLQRSLYGLKQAPRAWFQRFAAYITRVRFSQSRCDSSLFIYRQSTDTAYLLLYVDDMVLTTSSEIFRTLVVTESKLGDDGHSVSDLTLYRSLAGSLEYFTFTRPDIPNAVQEVCFHMQDPLESHFSALKRILIYVRGTLDYGLQLFASSTTSLVAYSDADWDGVDAEYRGVANAVAETCWLRNLLRELHTPLSFATLYANVFTKGLPSALFEEFRTSLSVQCPPAPTAGKC